MTAILMPAARAVVRPDRCENCAAHAPTQNPGLVECRIRAPAAHVVPGPGGQPGVVGGFVTMPIDGWCLEHKRGLINGG